MSLDCNVNALNLTSPITKVIPKTECIGNSLQTINNNYQILTEAIRRSNGVVKDIAVAVNKICNILQDSMKGPEIISYVQGLSGVTLGEVTHNSRKGQTFSKDVWTNIVFCGTPLEGKTPFTAPSQSSQPLPIVTINSPLSSISSLSAITASAAKTTFTAQKEGVYNIKLKTNGTCLQTYNYLLSRIVLNPKASSPTYIPQARFIQFIKYDVAPTAFDQTSINETIYLQKSQEFAIQLKTRDADGVTPLVWNRVWPKNSSIDSGLVVPFFMVTFEYLGGRS